MHKDTTWTTHLYDGGIFAGRDNSVSPLILHGGTVRLANDSGNDARHASCPGDDESVVRFLMGSAGQ